MDEFEEVLAKFTSSSGKEFMLFFKDILSRIEDLAYETESDYDTANMNKGIELWNRVTGDTHVAGGPFKEV